MHENLHAKLFNLINLIKDHELNKNDKKKLDDEFNSLLNELTTYCSSQIDILNTYRFIRGLENEFISCTHDLKENPITYSYVTKVKGALTIEKEVIELKIKYPDLRKAEVPYPSVKWTDSKVALVKLIYALQKSLNHGKATIKEIADCLQFVFQINVGNYYDIIQDINLRKDNPTRYLDSLVKNLEEVLRDLNKK